MCFASSMRTNAADRRIPRSVSTAYQSSSPFPATWLLAAVLHMFAHTSSFVSERKACMSLSSSERGPVQMSSTCSAALTCRPSLTQHTSTADCSNECRCAPESRRSPRQTKQHLTTSRSKSLAEAQPQCRHTEESASNHQPSLASEKQLHHRLPLPCVVTYRWAHKSQSRSARGVEPDG